MMRFRHLPILPILVLAFGLSTAAIAQDRAKLEQEIEALKQQIREKEREFLEPAKEDKAAFAEFLAQSDRGMFRLMPREKYRDKLLIREGGAYYSFTRLVHEYGNGSDISLEQGRLQAGFLGAGFGFITMIGDVPLDEITLTHPAVEFLANFNAPTAEPQAREQQHISGTGIAVQGFNYSRYVGARVNRTYVLRSIDYHQSDVLVAFRVIRQDADGSLTIIWKMLKDFPTPILERK
ncbi:MAG: hypothetical protein AB1757_27370 [Acidobacteriota bacterium]